MAGRLSYREEGSMAEKATLGGGCFWCIEPIFDDLKGVDDVVSGYIGGHVENPTYRQVCSGTTGHVEVVQVTFDPATISFEDILRVFFAFHDPTTRDRQGADVGPQYRSAIYYHSPEQKATAQRVIKELDTARVYRAPVVTELYAATTFYEAEEYHQEYYARNPEQGYCRVVIDPKVTKFRKQYAEKLKK
jgi:peptide-methionine (S)-S-oxide reductase